MPPSGYTFNQADHATEFLISCGQSLIAEAKADGLTPLQGLQREVANIDKLLSSGKFSPVECTLFSFNRHYYTQLIGYRSSSFEELALQLGVAADEIRTSLLSVENRTPSVLNGAACASK